jgi:hypothetical protein
MIWHRSSFDDNEFGQLADVGCLQALDGETLAKFSEGRCAFCGDSAWHSWVLL